MYLNIPVKLESYVSVIKNQTRFIANQNKLTLLKLGTTKGADSSKLMYLIYNPYPISMVFDCNSFLPKGEVFKTYPSVIEVSPKTAYAFVLFVSKVDEIALNEELLLNQLRANISARIQKLNVVRENEFEESRLFDINPEAIEINKTINLNSVSKQLDVEETFIKYKAAHESLVHVTLDSVETLDHEVKLNIKFENIDEYLNLEMAGFRLKMEDFYSKVIISAKESFTVKSKTTKIISVVIKEQEFDKIDLEYMKVKITII